jgi:hypothetical protein
MLLRTLETDYGAAAPIVTFVPVPDDIAISKK